MNGWSAARCSGSARLAKLVRQQGAIERSERGQLRRARSTVTVRSCAARRVRSSEAAAAPEHSGSKEVLREPCRHARVVWAKGAMRCTSWPSPSSSSPPPCRSSGGSSGCLLLRTTQSIHMQQEAQWLCLDIVSTGPRAHRCACTLACRLPRQVQTECHSHHRVPCSRNGSDAA